MKFVNFIRRLIALPFQMIAAIVLLVGLTLAIPFILIGRVIVPSDEQTSSAETINTLVELLNKFSNSKSDDDDSNDNDLRIAFQVKRLDKAFFS